jgi:hypothetical protein
MVNYISFYFILISINCFAQSESDTIYWSQENRLSWEDFQGVPDTDSNEFKYASAVTVARIIAKSYWEDDLPNFDVLAYFIKSRSWTYGGLSDSLLIHEQLHFDITELYARKIRKKVSELRENNIQDINIYSSEIKEYIENWRKEGRKYDNETKHGLDSDCQKKWENRINEQLEYYHSYE